MSVSKNLGVVLAFSSVCIMVAILVLTVLTWRKVNALAVPHCLQQGILYANLLQKQHKLSYEEFKSSIRCPDIGQDPLQYCLTTSGLIPSSGLVLEFGVFSGRTINSIADKLPSRKIYGFDSFEGLPETWQRDDGGFAAGHFHTNGELPKVPTNVKLIKGWFNETLPVFKADLAQHEDDNKIALLHIDCDLYSSTKTVFDEIGHLITKNTIIVFDELLNYPNAESHELLALYEFLQSSGHEIAWIGKNGPVIWNASSDNGGQFQSAAIRIVT